MDDIRTLLPKDKGDTESARGIVALGYPAVISVLPELMTWLQDMNWPVAKVIAPFLVSLGIVLVPNIREVLGTVDYEWKYWVLAVLVLDSPEVFAAVQAQVEQIAAVPPQNENEEAVQKQALHVLNHYRDVGTDTYQERMW